LKVNKWKLKGFVLVFVISYLYTMSNDKKKKSKERPDKYEEKLHIIGSLEDVLKVSVPKKKEKKS